MLGRVAGMCEGQPQFWDQTLQHFPPCFGLPKKIAAFQFSSIFLTMFSSWINAVVL